MFERFTERARKVLAHAGREAQRFHHDYIGTEHILLGLVKEDSGIAGKVLLERKADYKTLSATIESMVQSGKEDKDPASLPQTLHAKHVIQWAVEEARALHHNYLGTEHLLLALLRETEGMADKVLLEMGLQLTDLRQDVLNCLGNTDAEARTIGPLSPESAKEVMGDITSASQTGLKHIVMWTLKDEAAGATKQENAQRLKAMLEALPQTIKQIRSLEVGLNFAQSDVACDVVLVTAFDNETDLQTYQQHPEHQEVVAFIKQIVDQRYVVDYRS